jgi:hypothetical protein
MTATSSHYLFVCGLFNSAVSSWDYIVCHMTGWLMNDELEKIWKEVVTA